MSTIKRVNITSSTILISIFLFFPALSLKIALADGIEKSEWVHVETVKLQSPEEENFSMPLLEDYGETVAGLRELNMDVEARRSAAIAAYEDCNRFSERGGVDLQECRIETLSSLNDVYADARKKYDSYRILLKKQLDSEAQSREILQQKRKAREKASHTNIIALNQWKPQFFTLVEKLKSRAEDEALTDEERQMSDMLRGKMIHIWNMKHAYSNAIATLQSREESSLWKSKELHKRELKLEQIDRELAMRQKEVALYIDIAKDEGLGIIGDQGLDRGEPLNFPTFDSRPPIIVQPAKPSHVTHVTPLPEMSGQTVGETLQELLKIMEMMERSS